MLGALLSMMIVGWPESADALSIPSWAPWPQQKRLRVFIDAGHGAAGNDGNVGCYGQLERDHTRAVAAHLAFVLASLGPFDVGLSRRDDQQPDYKSRIRFAESFKADVIISLHSDARGDVALWQHDGGLYRRGVESPGFSVLWSDEGAHSVVARRARLGRAIGTSMRAAGFIAYSGADYGLLYRPDSMERSGWIDIRPDTKRVYFLRASPIPTVIVETHHALDPREVDRWAETHTVDVFALAIANALLQLNAQ